MPVPDTDKAFAGAIPQEYARRLVPLLFEPYAADLAARIAVRRPARVLELAAGTGVVTRAMASALPAAAAIVATDLNGPMIEQAAAAPISRPVEWRTADAMDLPFDDAAFDAVVCQFGVMFFPDRARAYAEARRVLTEGGVFLFSTWDRIEENALAEAVTEALARTFPEDPPRFMERTPHGYFDTERIRADLAAGGFPRPPAIDVVTRPSRAASARDAALAFTLGTPLRLEIEARDAGRLEAATDAAEQAIARRFGRGPVEAKMQAFVVGAES